MPADVSRGAGSGVRGQGVLSPDLSLRTHSQLEAVARVSVDVFERLLHGQSEQKQLAQVLPAVLTLLPALE